MSEPTRVRTVSSLAFGLGVFFWVVFAVLVAVMAWMSLSACNFRPVLPYFASYCEPDESLQLAPDAALLEDHRRIMREINQLERQLSAVPACENMRRNVYRFGEQNISASVPVSQTPPLTSKERL